MSRVSTDTFYSRAFHDMRQHQVEIVRLQAQIGSGKKLLRPSDDPAAASRALDLTETIRRIDQYEENSVLADQRLALQDSTLAGVEGLLIRVKELALAANSGAQTAETRNAYRSELRERLSELLDFANVRDANGDYLYAGFKGETRPFDLVGGGVAYNGDQGVRELQVSATRRIAVGDSGDRVFMHVPAGNGRFTVDADGANTGTAIVAAGSVVDPTAFQHHDYSIRFTAPGTYDVVDDTLGVTVLAAQSYSDGARIQFDGIATSISGQPAAGDRFDIRSGVSQPIFVTLQTFIDAMAQDPQTADAATRLTQTMNGVIDSLDRAIDHVLEVRTSVGARQNALQAVEVESQDLRLELQTALSGLQDVEMDAAIGRLQQRIGGLEAVQQTFVALARLSLFNFLR